MKVTITNNTFTIAGLWNVEIVGDHWALQWGVRGVVPICPAEWQRSLALDAACEFMDRVRENRIPVGLDNDAMLMSFCLDRSRRQK